MQRLRILLTTCGALTSPSLIDAIKQNGEREITVVGIDGFPHVAGALLVDRFYQVPPSSEDETAFVERIVEIVGREAIDVILPCGHEDCLAIAKRRDMFEAAGAKVAVSPYEILVRGFDKGLVYETLREHDAGAPEFYCASTFDEFLVASDRLGYPKEPIVLKPRLSRGGRGVMILHPDIDFASLLNSKADINYPFEYVAGLLRQQRQFPQVIVMEYLPGEFYSVDLLADHGRPLITVPKIRLWGTPSQTLRGLVDLNPPVIAVAQKACRAFGFSYNVNFEIKLSRTGAPMIYDSNPRLAASTAFCAAAGANLVYFAIKLALGEEIPTLAIKNRVMMIRYFKELYLRNGQVQDSSCPV
ncbi:MAG: ATP-grasp domain-containing protein [Candidatus Omnitrophota bacterium]|nr:ATP-grasp domain-containing protein [Candidatus Omnitrophota bacterium]